MNDVCFEKTISIRNYMTWLIFGILTIPLVVGIIILAIIILKYYYHKITIRYTFREKTIVVKKGFIAKNQTEVRYADIRNIKIHQGVIQRIFRVGNIMIDCAASNEVEISLLGIGNPQKVVDFINNQR